MIDIPAGLPPKVRKHYRSHREQFVVETGATFIHITCDIHADVQPASPTTVQSWFAKVGYQLLSYGVVLIPDPYCVFHIVEQKHE